MSLGIGTELHDKAYMEVLLHTLDSKEGKEALFLNLKKGGLVTGGAVLGTLLLGPIGMAIGGVVAGGKAKEMKGHAEAYKDMLQFLREMNKEEKHILVTLIEDLVGDKDTDSLQLFVKSKTSKERLLNCVYNFLSDQFDYNATKPRKCDSEQEGSSDIQTFEPTTFR